MLGASRIVDILCLTAILSVNSAAEHTSEYIRIHRYDIRNPFTAIPTTPDVVVYRLAREAQIFASVRNGGLSIGSLTLRAVTCVWFFVLRVVRRNVFFEQIV